MKQICRYFLWYMMLIIGAVYAADYDDEYPVFKKSNDARLGVSDEGGYGYKGLDIDSLLALLDEQKEGAVAADAAVSAASSTYVAGTTSAQDVAAAATAVAPEVRYEPTEEDRYQVSEILHKIDFMFSKLDAGSVKGYRLIVLRSIEVFLEYLMIPALGGGLVSCESIMNEDQKRMFNHYKTLVTEYLNSISPFPVVDHDDDEEPIDTTIVPDDYFFIRSVSSWIDACKQLDKNRCAPIVADKMSAADLSNPKNNGFKVAGLESEDQRWEEMMRAIALFIEQKSDSLSNDRLWVNYKEKESYEISDMVKKPVYESDLPYAYIQKKVFSNGDELYMHGDYHGDIISLVSMLELFKQKNLIDDQFHLLNPRMYLLFLGDYTDRGLFGSEVIYTVLRLAVANPDHVILVRGNHEHFALNERDGFSDEIKAKFNSSSLLMVHFVQSFFLNVLYNYMPLALYAGCRNDKGGTNYIQCCHGGIDPRYHAVVKDFLTTRYMYCALKDCSNINGFMWTDFQYDPTEESSSTRGSSEIIKYSKKNTEDALKEQSTISDHVYLKGIIRGHQHSADPENPLMRALVDSKGIYKMWRPIERAIGDHEHRVMHDGTVWTANVAPDSVYGYEVGFNFDTYIKVVTNVRYEDWRMFVYTIIHPEASLKNHPRFGA